MFAKTTFLVADVVSAETIAPFRRVRNATAAPEADICLDLTSYCIVILAPGYEAANGVTMEPEPITTPETAHIVEFSAVTVT